jgi:hypothetical protein
MIQETLARLLVALPTSGRSAAVCWACPVSYWHPVPMTDSIPQPKYRGPDWTRNAFALLRALTEESGEEGFGRDIPEFRMGDKANELQLCAQGEIGGNARETMYAAVKLAGFFAAKYANATDRDFRQVIEEAQLEFEANIPDMFEPRSGDIPDN